MDPLQSLFLGFRDHIIVGAVWFSMCGCGVTPPSPLDQVPESVWGLQQAEEIAKGLKQQREAAVPSFWSGRHKVRVNSIVLVRVIFWTPTWGPLFHRCGLLFRWQVLVAIVTPEVVREIVFMALIA